MNAVPDALLDEDRMHHPGADRRWRESYYFSFFDPVHRIGGFSFDREARGQAAGTGARST